jgi:hypothetical protein
MIQIEKKKICHRSRQTRAMYSSSVFLVDWLAFLSAKDLGLYLLHAQCDRISVECMTELELDLSICRNVTPR